MEKQIAWFKHEWKIEREFLWRYEIGQKEGNLLCVTEREKGELQAERKALKL